jgi:hypothetical protein
MDETEKKDSSQFACRDDNARRVTPLEDENRGARQFGLLICETAIGYCSRKVFELYPRRRRFISLVSQTLFRMSIHGHV